MIQLRTNGRRLELSRVWVARMIPLGATWLLQGLTDADGALDTPGYRPSKLHRWWWLGQLLGAVVLGILVMAIGVLLAPVSWIGHELLRIPWIIEVRDPALNDSWHFSARGWRTSTWLLQDVQMEILGGVGVLEAAPGRRHSAPRLRYRAPLHPAARMSFNILGTSVVIGITAFFMFYPA